MRKPTGRKLLETGDSSRLTASAEETPFASPETAPNLAASPEETLLPGEPLPEGRSETPTLAEAFGPTRGSDGTQTANPTTATATPSAVPSGTASGSSAPTPAPTPIVPGQSAGQTEGPTAIPGDPETPTDLSQAPTEAPESETPQGSPGSSAATTPTDAAAAPFRPSPTESRAPTPNRAEAETSEPSPAPTGSDAWPTAEASLPLGTPAPSCSKVVRFAMLVKAPQLTDESAADLEQLLADIVTAACAAVSLELSSEQTPWTTNATQEDGTEAHVRAVAEVRTRDPAAVMAQVRSPEFGIGVSRGAEAYGLDVDPESIELLSETPTATATPPSVGATGAPAAGGMTTSPAETATPAATTADAGGTQGDGTVDGTGTPGPIMTGAPRPWSPEIEDLQFWTSEFWSKNWLPWKITSIVIVFSAIFFCLVWTVLDCCVFECFCGQCCCRGGRPFGLRSPLRFKKRTLEDDRYQDGCFADGRRDSEMMLQDQNPMYVASFESARRELFSYNLPGSEADSLPLEPTTSYSEWGHGPPRDSPATSENPDDFLRSLRSREGSDSAADDGGSSCPPEPEEGINGFEELPLFDGGSDIAHPSRQETDVATGALAEGSKQSASSSEAEVPLTESDTESFIRGEFREESLQ